MNRPPAHAGPIGFNPESRAPFKLPSQSRDDGLAELLYGYILASH